MTATLPTTYELTEPIHTARLMLRPLRPGDLDDVHAYQSRADVCQYLMFEPRSRDEVLERLERYAVATGLAAEGDFLQLALVLDHGGRSRVTTNGGPATEGLVARVSACRASPEPRHRSEWQQSRPRSGRATKRL